MIYRAFQQRDMLGTGMLYQSSNESTGSTNVLRITVAVVKDDVIADAPACLSIVGVPLVGSCL